MSIKALIAAVPPPTRPFEAFAGPWRVMEEWLGTALPQDYKDFARTYGSGNFLQFMGIFIPHTRNRFTRLENQIGLVCRSFAEVGAESLYPFWPEGGGLVPLGVADNGSYFFWLTRGATPEDWRIVAWDRGGMDLEAYETFDCGLTDFLAGIATGEITPRALPAGLLPCDQPFVPDDQTGQDRRLRWQTQFAWRARLGW